MQSLAIYMLISQKFSGKRIRFMTSGKWVTFAYTVRSIPGRIIVDCQTEPLFSCFRFMPIQHFLGFKCVLRRILYHLVNFLGQRYLPLISQKIILFWGSYRIVRFLQRFFGWRETFRIQGCGAVSSSRLRFVHSSASNRFSLLLMIFVWERFLNLTILLFIFFAEDGSFGASWWVLFSWDNLRWAVWLLHLLLFGFLWDGLDGLLE